MEFDTGKEKLEFQIPRDFTFEVLEPLKCIPKADYALLLQRALRYPISSPTLAEMCCAGQRVCLIINDYTRYLLQKPIIAEIILELKGVGIKEDEITILIATGTHRPCTNKEIREMLGEDIAQSIRIRNHDAFDQKSLVKVGYSTRFGIPLVFNKYVLEADIRIGIGLIEPHLFAGYSGGVKILAIGAAGLETISATHNAQILAHQTTRNGTIEDNIFREMLNESVEAIGLDFIVNVVQDKDKQALAIFAGHPIQAFEKGVEFARKVYEVDTTKQADVVIAIPKYPKTLNLYQAIRTANNVVFNKPPLLKKSGVLIIPMRCSEGFGAPGLYETLSEAKDPGEIIKEAMTRGFPPEGHKAFTISRVLQYCEVIITDTDISSEALIKSHFQFAPTVASALAILDRRPEKTAGHVTILPDAFLTVPRVS